MIRAIGLAMALLAAASCSYQRSSFDWPEVPGLPPAPPERALRHPADFTFRNHAQKKQYFLRIYEEPGFEEQLVTVVELDDPDKGERLATLDEYDYAISVFEREWLEKPLNERLKRHQELRRNERRRNAEQLDTRIRHLDESIAILERERFDEVESKLNSARETGTSIEAEHLAFLRKEKERYDFEIVVLRNELKILQYKAWLRDQEFTKHTLPQFTHDRIPVADLLQAYTDPLDLIAEIRANVRPREWDRGYAGMEIVGSTLHVRHVEEVIVEVREFLSRLRAGLRAMQEDR